MKHEGVAVRAMEKRGIDTEIGSLNKEINNLNRKIDLINKQIKAQEGIKEILYGTKDNGVRNQNIRVRTRDDEMEQGYRRYTLRSNNTSKSTVELLKQTAREKRERDKEYQERIERENRKRFEQERQKSNIRTYGRTIEGGMEL